MLENKPSVTTLTQSLRGLSTPYEKESKGQEDIIFDIFKIPNKNQASIGRLLAVLKQFAFRDNDSQYQRSYRLSRHTKAMYPRLSTIIVDLGMIQE